jgi:hypothetical protein
MAYEINFSRGLHGCMPLQNTLSVASIIYVYNSIVSCSTFSAGLLHATTPFKTVKDKEQATRLSFLKPSRENYLRRLVDINHYELVIFLNIAGLMQCVTGH